jgi:hypothetical protein
VKFFAYILMLCVLLVGSGKVLHIHTCGTTGEKSISFFKSKKCHANQIAVEGEEGHSCEKSCCHPTEKDKQEEETPCDDSSLEILLDLKKDGESAPTKIPDFSVVYTITLDSFTQVEISFSQEAAFVNKAPPLPDTTAEKLQRWII